MPDSIQARLLIVDDETAQMQALCRTLEEEGYATTGFASATQALERLRAGEEFDLLLTDLQMPEMDGIALLTEAKKIDPNLFCIIMTGHGTIDTAVQAMKSGAFDYLLKPFKLSIMLPALGRALGWRTLHIANAELDRSLKQRTAELEVANRELESFSYSISHDLRAPLRAIIGFTDILTEDHAGQLDEEGLRHLQTVVSSARRMEQLIEDLLAFSRLGRHPINKQPLQMTKLVQGVITELQRGQAPPQEMEIELGALPDCQGDVSLLRQVLINLVSNAFKFTRDRHPARIEIGCYEEGKEQVYFVRDNGAGFDMKFADKLFGVFQRLHRAEDFEGTGIGLSIVQRIVQRHGGRIWAQSKVNEGATFFFTLPCD